MCSLCAALGANRNWSDAAGHDAFRQHGGKVTARGEREQRVAVLNRLLSTRGITIADWGGNSFILQDKMGRRENVYNLAGIWAQIHEMLGTALDPLSPELLAAIDPPGFAEPQ
jgi:hypothetical protein